jgi:Raf kinase inhibitor-like YbhB/YbcL family protein
MNRSFLVPKMVMGIVVGLSNCGCGKKQDVPAIQLALTHTSPTQAHTTLKISSPDVKAGGFIPDRFSSYSRNQIPRIKWTSGPSGTRSYVLLLEDPDAPGSKPFVHWLVINIPAKVTQAPGPGLLLNNQNGAAAYYGPHPPPGPAHHYVFQVFALDRAEIWASDRDGAVRAMQGHVLAKGQLTALYQKK